MTADKNTLQDRQERFCREYVIDHNGEGAARRAGYKNPSKSKVSRNLLKLEKIQRRIEELEAPVIEKLEITHEAVIRELALVGFSNLRDFVDWGPDGVTIKAPDLLDNPEKERCIQSIRVQETANGTTTTLKMHDKISALEKLGRHMGMFGNGHEAPPPGAVIVNIGYLLDEADVEYIETAHADYTERRKSSKRRLGYGSDGLPNSTRGQALRVDPRESG